MSDFATPEDITAATKRKVNAVVKAVVAGKVNELFPMPIRVKVKLSSGTKPSLQAFAAATQKLVAGSKATTGSGYTLNWCVESHERTASRIFQTESQLKRWMTS